MQIFAFLKHLAVRIGFLCCSPTCQSYAAPQRQISHCAFFLFTSQSWALSKKGWGQRKQARRTEHTVPTHWQENGVPRYRAFFLFLIWWNGHCCQFCSASVSWTLLISRCGCGVVARWYQPNEKCVWSLQCVFTLTWKDYSFPAANSHSPRLSFSLSRHFCSFPGSWSFSLFSALKGLCHSCWCSQLGNTHLS